jgi:mono/diheme cytochrome c family protein
VSSTAIVESLVLAMCLCASGCERAPKTKVERGAGTFLRLCSGCHGPDGRGTTRPGFAVRPANLRDPALQKRLADAEIERTIRNGKGQMPAFGKLVPDDEIEAIIAYLRTLDLSRSASVEATDPEQ